MAVACMLLCVAAPTSQRLELRYRYFTRPPPTNERTQSGVAGQFAIVLTTPWRDRTSQVVMSPLDFKQCLTDPRPSPTGADCERR